MEVNNTALDSIGSSVSKAIDGFRRSKLIKVWVIIGLALVGIIILAVKLIKKKALTDIPLPDLPNGGKDIADIDTFKLEAELIAKNTFTVTDGVFTTATTKEDVFLRLMKLNNDSLIYTYRVFNKEYYPINKETMTQAIDDEIFVKPAAIGGVRDKLVARLISLGAR